MHLLVFNDKVRVAIVVAGSATVYELKEKVAKQTAGAWPVGAQELRLHGELLADEMTLSEQGVADRDRIELASPAAPGASESMSTAAGGTSQLQRLLVDLDEVAAKLDDYEEQIRRGESVHQE